jgi:hypothetical protein
MYQHIHRSTVANGYRISYRGFKELVPNFSIRDAGADQLRLPTASTCVNLLKVCRPPLLVYTSCFNFLRSSRITKVKRSSVRSCCKLSHRMQVLICHEKRRDRILVVSLVCHPMLYSYVFEIPSSIVIEVISSLHAVMCVRP